MTEPSATAFGKYTVARLLGRGGMATVYEANDPDLGRRVAIKVVHPHLAFEAGFRERFQAEARLVASLRHPNIVQVYDFDATGAQTFMVMEFLEGGTLRDRIEVSNAIGQSVMPFEQCAALMESLGSALDYAHDKGAIHRDIKPANIMFTSAGVPVITDFGIAKIMGGSQLTTSGSIVGSPAYIAPEQANAGKVDGRADQYALGCVLYELLTGRLPFPGDNMASVLMQHMTQPPQPPRELNPALPAAAEAVVLKALAKEPIERYAIVADMAHAFRMALSAPPKTRTSNLPISSAAQMEATVVEPRAAPKTEVRTKVEAPRTPSAPTPLPPAADMPAAPPAGAPPDTETRTARLNAGRQRVLLFAGLFILLVLIAAGGFAFLNNKPTASGTAANNLRFRDGTRSTDEIALSLTSLPAPAAGTQYEAWLTGDGGEKRRSLGLPKFNGASGALVFTNPDGKNLLGDFDAVEISIEPSPDNNPLPSGKLVLRGTLPPQALVHLRHLLVAREDTPGHIGYATGLLREARTLQQTGADLLTAQQARDLTAVRANAERIANLIEGMNGQHAGDLDGDGVARNPGDGFGLLLNGANTGYVQGTSDHAQLGFDQPDATPNIKAHALLVKVCVKNVGEWSVSLRDLALQILKAPDTTASEGPVRSAASLANRILNGQDLNGNDEVEPIANECGALLAYQQAQFMSDIALSAP